MARVRLIDPFVAAGPDWLDTVLARMTIDFLAEKLGSPHQMRFGAYALYGKTAPAKVAER